MARSCARLSRSLAGTSSRKTGLGVRTGGLALPNGPWPGVERATRVSIWLIFVALWIWSRMATMAWRPLSLTVTKAPASSVAGSTKVSL